MAQFGTGYLKFNPAGRSAALPDPGTTEHALLILLALELVALMLLRRYFAHAHGG
jgi:hypothetical protein